MEEHEDGMVGLRVPPRVATAAGAVIAPLDEATTRALLGRLEPLPAVVTGAAAPSTAPKVAPPPTGPVTPLAFAAPSGRALADLPVSPRAQAAAGVPIAPLAPPEIQPAGEIGAEREVRIRFAEPMIPIAAIGPVAAPPATITPDEPGAWRWIDTHVLSFSPAAARLRGATEFTVTVAAGTRAVSTAALATPTVGRFATEPLEIIRGFPSATVRPDSPIAVMFDQDLDPAQVVPFLRVEDGHRRALPFRVIELAEAAPLWARNPALATTNISAALGLRYLILAPTRAWPAGVSLDVVLRPGAPSAEGPRRSTRPTSQRFEVAAPFTVAGVACGERARPMMTGARCPAEGFLQLEFSNPIDETSYHAPLVQLLGEPFDDHAASGSSVDLQAPAKVGKTYTFAIGDGLRDAYGQPLVGPRQPSFTTTEVRFAPSLDAPSGLIVLDPRFTTPQWIVLAEAVAELHVELYRVTLADYAAYEAFEQGTRPRPPGTRVFQHSYPVGPRHGVHARVDLRPALTGELGHLVAVATITPAPGHRSNEAPTRTAWIQVTRLGVTARVDRERVHAWVADISARHFLTPTPGATATLLVDGKPVAAAPTTSDAEGQVTLELPPAAPPGAPAPRVRRREPTAMLAISAGADTTFAIVSGAHERAIRNQSALWYATDDRFTYKPGEPVYVKGWVRWTHDGINPGLTPPAAGDVVAYELTDARGHQLGKGTAPLTDQGGFDLKVDLPKDAELGTAVFSFTTRNQHHSHPIAIQDFRTPAFAVTLEDDLAFHGARPLILGESLELRAEAKYYAGGGLPGAGLDWQIELTPASYRPPGWDAYTFTTAVPASSPYRGTLTRTQQDTLGGDAAAGLVLDLTALADHRPSVLAIDATVSDVDRMHIRASSRPILVHPSAYYVGLRQHPNVDDQLLDVVVTDIDGHPVPDVAIDVTVAAVLGSERYRDGAKVVDTQRCALTSTAAPVTCAWKRGDDKWAYTATALIHDGRGRVNSARYPVPWFSYEADRDLALIPDRPLYHPGDVAHLQLTSKILPATALVSFARQGVIAQRRIALTTPTTTFDLPIDVGYLRNVHVLVDRAGPQLHPAAPGAPPLPEHVEAHLDLPVDVESARLVMTATATAPLVEPGAPASFDVEVRHDDQPVAGAEVALLVVDEAVLALSTKRHEDPLAPFYRHVDPGATSLSTLPLIEDAGVNLDGEPGVERFKLVGLNGYGTIGYGSGGGGLGSSAGRAMAGASVVTSRKDFRATAAWAPRLHTDAHGRARLTVTMPDSLTRFRMIALATADTHLFGKAEGTIITQRLVNARTIAPRFLSQGDAFALPVVVQNLDHEPRTIDVAVRAANLADVGPRGQRVTLQPGQRAEVRFGFATAARGGVAIQTIVASGTFADASTVKLPVYEPATTEAFASYGVVDDAPRFEQVVVPTALFPDVGGVEVELASSQLQRLSDAYWYLYEYPYECAEQRSARMIATSALADILDAFAVPGRPTRAELDETRAHDLTTLAKTQLPDGSWGYFPGMRGDPVVTNQVLIALSRQKESTAALPLAINYVTREAQAVLARLDRAAAARTPADLVRYDVGLAASALTALAASGRDVTAQAVRLHAVATALAAYPVDAEARVLALLAGRPAQAAIRQALLTKLLAATHETAAGATVTTSYVEAERLLLVSSAKTDALVLDALLREVPKHDLVAKLTHGLLDAQRRGRWRSTQENLTALVALRRYFDTFEAQPPNYTGKVWLGRVAYAEQPFVDRTTPPAATRVGWPALTAGASHDVAIVKDGPGRMYYRLGITYAPRPTAVSAFDAGFVVRRSYEAIDDPSDVVRDQAGRWHVGLGARVRVVVEILTSTRRNGVAVVDPIPAGFEAVNSALAIAERPAASDDDERWDYRQLRDTRSEVFTMALSEGTHRFSYTVRATTPGTFIAAPAKAEEMYSPETFGRTAPATIVVE